MSDINVLIVEDEFLMYNHIKETLKSFGFQNIDVARDYNKAIQVANDKKIDLLFSDIKIDSSKDGIDTALQIQNLYNTPVIFITAYSDKETLKKASKVNDAQYLLKPYRPDELEALIKILIYKYKLDKKNTEIKINDYTYCLESKKLYIKNKEQSLTKKEKLFLNLLFSNFNEIVLYSCLDNIVWQGQNINENTRRTFIYRFKNKFPNLNIFVEKNIGIGIFQ